MEYVLDSSMALSWYFEDEVNSFSERLFDARSIPDVLEERDEPCD